MLITLTVGLVVTAPIAAGDMWGVAAGRERPTLSSAVRSTSYADPERGVSAVLPPGWRAAGPLTSLSFPREVVTLATFALRRGGGCGPDRALAHLPSAGALIFVFEYRPDRGAVWTGSRRRSSFPPRPAHLRLPRDPPRSYECFSRPGYLLRFRDAERPLQAMVALGPKATAARRHEVERVLDGLRFAPLAPPPPDPYAGWPTLVDESGDSLRVPPQWTRAVTAIPRRLSRPRTLLVTASHRLAGLPGGRAGRVGALPAPGVTPGLGQLPSDAWFSG